MGFGPYRSKDPQMAAADYDLTLPLAALLRLGTAHAHEAAEHSPGAGWLLRGELDRAEYARFLMMLYHVYIELEAALDKLATLPVLVPTYNPGLLTRAPRLVADIAFLLDTPESDWQSHPVHVDLLAHPPPPFSAYLDRVRIVAATPVDAPPQEGPGRLLAHAYVRYLGDLSGGQAIRRRIAKAYDIDPAKTAGVEFYRFGSLDGARADAEFEDRKEIREWYRDGMNAGAGDDEELKLAILEEAILVFELNTALFSALRPPANLPPSPSLSPLSSEVIPPPGDPSTPLAPSMTFGMLAPPAMAPSSSYSSSDSASVSSSLPPSPNPGDDNEGVLATLDKAAAPASRTYPVSSVIAVVGAILLGHFLLVVGGVTGSKGWISKVVESL